MEQPQVDDLFIRNAGDRPRLCRLASPLRAAGVPVRLMLSLETIGCFNDAKGSQSYPFAPLRSVYPDRGDSIAFVGRYGDWRITRWLKGAMRGFGGIPVESINAPVALPAIDISDQRRGDTADRLDWVRMSRVM